MKVGIDSYCYHRLFGEVYPGQIAPDSLLTFESFMLSLAGLGIEGISLESCFIPRFDAAYLGGIKAQLDELALDRVYAWGHPDGLEGGKNEAAYDEMIEHIAHASAIGATVMRVVGSSLRYRAEPTDKKFLFAYAWGEGPNQHCGLTWSELGTLAGLKSILIYLPRVLSHIWVMLGTNAVAWE